jgi:hypothetical protein
VPLIHDIEERIAALESAYHRLLLVVGETRSGKTGVMKELGERLAAPLVNVNLRLSRDLLDVPPQRRPLRTSELLEDIVQPSPTQPTLLDNIELLFDPELKQDPLRLLQLLSRRGTLVVSWPGTMVDDSLVYAEPGHPEYRRYERPDVAIVKLPDPD